MKEMKSLMNPILEVSLWLVPLIHIVCPTYITHIYKIYITHIYNIYICYIHFIYKQIPTPRLLYVIYTNVIYITYSNPCPNNIWPPEPSPSQLADAETERPYHCRDTDIEKAWRRQPLPRHRHRERTKETERPYHGRDKDRDKAPSRDKEQPYLRDKYRE